MAIALEQLPDDIDALKSRVADEVARNQQLQCKVNLLQEQLNLALARRYAASSEKLSPEQVSLFDEAESDAGQAEQVPDEEVVTIAEHSRKKRGRKPLPAALPRVEVIHELTEDARH